MATLQSAWNAFWGLETKAAAPPPAPPEVRSLVFSPGSYPDAAGDYWNPLLTQAFGGYSAAWNSAVYACIKVLCYAFQEAPPKVYRLQADGTEQFLEEHRLMALLADPHPSLSGPELTFWVQYCKQVDGNAYLRKIRNRAGEVVQLWPISPGMVSPETTAEDARAGVFISHYVYDDGKGTHERVPPEDIVHFRLGVDDTDHRKGLSNLRRLLREISSDEEATAFTDSLLKNFGVTSLAVSVPPGPVLTEEQAEQIRDRLRADYGGTNRGHVAVVANGATLQPMGFNPQQLDLKAAHQIPETRICAVLGVPAMLVGLSAGLEHTIYNNMEQAQEHLYEQTVVPLWRADAATLTKQLLRPDFDADPAVRLKFDTDDVRALQEDMDERYARLSVAVEKGWVTKDEARAEVGLEPLPDGLGEAQDPMELLKATAAARGGPPGAQDDEDGGPPARKALEQKQRSLSYLPELLAVLQTLNQPLVEQDLEAYFAGQAERVMAAAKQEG